VLRYDLQRGVYRVLEALEGDRRELARLQRKAVEMRRRQLSGRTLDGEEEELRSLLLGASDLERKLQRALEEVERLAAKTEQLIERQQLRDEQRRRRMEEESAKNQALQLLIKDLNSLDELLKDLTDVRRQFTKAEGIHRQMRALNSGNEDDNDEVDTDEMILERICVDTQAATDDILKTREDIQKVQDMVLVKLAEDVDVVGEAAFLQANIIFLNIWKTLLQHF
jgi:hypothetical protein